jgi:hypothetical protein
VSATLRPAEHYEAAYERDLIAVREHSKIIASYLLQAGVPDWQVRSVLVSVTEAGVNDARAER